MDKTGYYQIFDTELSESCSDQLDETGYLDTDVVPGVLYRYSISAVDRSGNESPPSDPVETRIGLPETPVSDDQRHQDRNQG